MANDSNTDPLSGADELLSEFDDALKALASPAESLASVGEKFVNSGEGFQPIRKEAEFDADTEIRDYLGFMHRAREAHKLHRSARLITAQVTDQLPNGQLPEIKKLAVPPDSTMFLFSERHAPVQLDPGEEYEVSRLGLGGGLGQSLDAFGDHAGSGSFQERSGVLICEIPRRSLPLTITLPDHYGFFPPGEGSRFPELLTAMSASTEPEIRKEFTETLARELGRVFEESRLKSQEGICTGVRVQLEIGISNPQRLVETYCRAYSRQLQKTYSDLDKQMRRTPLNPGLANKLRFPLKLLTQVCFGARKENGVPLKPITLAHVYRRIRLEIADALRDAIRQETAKQLIEEPARVRERVTDALEQHVRQSLSLYGTEIRRVVSVECVSPEYNRMIIERGRLKMRVEQLEDDAQRARIEDHELDIDSQRFRDQVRHQNERSRFATAEQGETARKQLEELSSTKEVEDRVEAEVLRRRLERETEASAHRREEELRDAEARAVIEREQQKMQLEVEAQRLELQQQKIESAVKLNLQYEQGQSQIQQDALDREHRRQQELLQQQFEHHMATNAAEMENRLGFLEKFAGLSQDIDENKLLVMALASDPRLAKPYVEATRAKGQEELVERMNDFKDQLVAVHGEKNELVHQLWEEGVRQIGHVLGKTAEKPATNLFADNVRLGDKPTKNSE